MVASTDEVVFGEGDDVVGDDRGLGARVDGVNARVRVVDRIVDDVP